MLFIFYQQKEHMRLMVDIFDNSFNLMQITVLFTHFLLAIAFALILSFTIKRTSGLLGDKSQYTVLFPIIIPTMVLIILIIKSSLALSLGLVGALSIIRFRTPIKDPEELAYIFIAIALGLGIGAGKLLVTTMCFIILISTLIIIFLVRKNQKPLQGIFLDITLQSKSSKGNLTDFSSIITKHNIAHDLRRYEEDKDRISATYYIEPQHINLLEKILTEFKSVYKELNITIVNSSQNI